MGKDNKKKSDFTPMSDLMEEKKKLEKKISRAAIPCSHTNDKGKVKVEFLGKGNLVRCKKCGAKFDFSSIQMDDLEEAARILHNAINQIKALSDDPEREQSVIRSLGEMDYNLKEMVDLYRKSVNNYGKGQKKNKNRDNDFGSYGMGSISFIGGKKNRY